MNTLRINAGKVHPFVFEQYAEEQLTKLKREHQQANIKLPQTVGVSRQNSGELIKSIKGAANRDDAIIGTLALKTFTRTNNRIEGYLAKEIDTKGMLRRQKRHLRYFRVIFSSGKLCIKEDR